MGTVIAIVVGSIAAIAVGIFMLRSRGITAPAGETPTPRTHPAPPVADFHVEGDTAAVSFEVPLPDGEADEVLRNLLVREAIEVVREKRHQLPIDQVSRVAALGKRGDQWIEVGSVSLETAGQLPPPAVPVVIPGLGSEHSFDPFDHISNLPEQAPGLEAKAGGDSLTPLAAEVQIPAAVQAGLRAQGIDPGRAEIGDMVLGIMRFTGSTVTPIDDDTYAVMGAGHRTMVRIVPHRSGEHPELAEADVRRFAADFANSDTDRALLITEKYCPFDVYDRENRDPRARYITRERVQRVIDALALG